MRRPESYSRHAFAALALTLAILVSFQVYVVREPARIAADEAADHTRSLDAGRQLYREHCTDCHGANGDGGSGPALNSRPLLELTNDDVLFSLARTGVPGTTMPAWGQLFGGPLTDEQLGQVVTYLRSWQPTAPDPTPVSTEPDPVAGARIYARTCGLCHGPQGEGTDRARALNDARRLSKLDDAWYRNTVAHGRPAKGMPTWGTVLSPGQIDDVVALLAAWRAGKTVSAAVPLASSVSSALFAVRQFDPVDAEYFLGQALGQADRAQAAEIRAILDLIHEGRLSDAQSRLLVLLPPAEMGMASFEANCAACHGADGSGSGRGPMLRDNAFVQSASDDELITLVLAGRDDTAMEGFEGVLARDELVNLVALLRAWQE